MGVDCRIFINQPREGWHKPGNCLTGAVKYVVDKPTEFQDVTLSLFGKAKAKWTENHGRSSTTYTGLQELITRTVNVTNKAPDQTVTLHGVYEYPFEFHLPEDLPTTYKDKHGNVTYSIEMKFEKPSFFSINKVVTQEFPVYGYVAPMPILGEEEQYLGPVIFGVEKELCAPFSTKKPVVKLKAEIAKNCMTPGEQIQLSLVVSNQTNGNVLSVSAELFSYTTYSCGKNTKKKKAKMQGCTGRTASILKGTVGSVTCVLPTLPELFSLQNCQVVKKEYRVRVTLVLPSPHCNAIVEMPIVLGELKQVNVDPEVMALLQSIQNTPDLPPEYSEI